MDSTTAPIAFNATAAQVQAALEALSNIGPGNLSATGGDVDTARVDITFIGAFAGVDVPSLTANATALTGTTPTVATTSSSKAARSLSSCRPGEAVRGRFWRADMARIH